MKYCDADADLTDVVRHLRNKNMGIYPVQRSPMFKLVDRLVRRVTRLRDRALLKTGWEAVVSEQIVESALILRHLRPTDRQVLDFGGYESLLPLTISALGHHVTVLDQRVYPFKGARLRSVTADLFGEHPLAPNSFDLVFSVSTIEHLGLGGYKDAQLPEGDRLGVERLWQLVRPGGRLMATVPAGRPGVRRGYRTYDETRLRTVFPHLTTTAWFSKDGRFGTWSPSSAEAVADLAYGEPEGSLPVEAVVFVICEKS
jgi:SAM-dependent methyltransferase